MARPDFSALVRSDHFPSIDLETSSLLPPTVADPVVTVRCFNPQYNCATEIYCLDVQFKSDMAGKVLFGMNVRFLYEDATLEFNGFAGFVASYGQVSPIPAVVSTLSSGVPWGFSGSADYVNAAIQIGDPNNGVTLSTTNWTTLFQICFTVDNAPNEEVFCPSIVWDLEQNPANGGYSGNAGVVMTVVNGSGSSNAIESVDHHNWHYIGSGNSPYGEPITEICSSIVCGTCSLIVTSNANSGPNTLRDIITCASSGDTIGFISTLAGSTITISTTKIIIDKNLYIRSNLNPRVKITSSIPGLFEIGAGKTVEFKDLEITTGTTLTDNSGGAFKNQGILRLINVQVYKNTGLATGQYLIRNYPSSQCLFFGNCFVEIP